MKKYLFTGFLTFLPLALTTLIVIYLFDVLTAPFVGLFKNMFVNYELRHGINPEAHPDFILFISRLTVLIVLFVLVFLLGFFGRKFLIHTLLKITNKIFSRIPFVKSIYRISVDVTKAFFSPGKKMFDKTVLIPFPNHQTHAIGFVTGDVPIEMKKVIVDLELSVFVPTSPHPLSGFMLMTPKKNVIDVDISVQDAFTFLVSCGTIHPGQPLPKENLADGK